MPNKVTKGGNSNNDRGSAERGNQKATYGSAVDPEVAEGQKEAIGTDDSESDESR